MTINTSCFEEQIYKSSNLSEKTVLKSFAEISYLETQLFTNNKLIETHVKLIVTKIQNRVQNIHCYKSLSLQRHLLA